AWAASSAWPGPHSGWESIRPTAWTSLDEEPAMFVGHSRGILALIWLVVPAFADEKPKLERVVPLRHAHAHNDYLHHRPLLDALDHGFCSIEADIFLVSDQLLVGHERRDLRPERTLEKLYLDPLRERVKANGGRVYPGGPAFYLLIDVKTE